MNPEDDEPSQPPEPSLRTKRRASSPRRPAGRGSRPESRFTSTGDGAAPLEQGALNRPGAGDNAGDSALLGPTQAPGSRPVPGLGPRPSSILPSRPGARSGSLTSAVRTGLRTTEPSALGAGSGAGPSAGDAVAQPDLLRQQQQQQQQVPGTSRFTQAAAFGAPRLRLDLIRRGGSGGGGSGGGGGETGPSSQSQHQHQPQSVLQSHAQSHDRYQNLQERLGGYPASPSAPPIAMSMPTGARRPIMNPTIPQTHGQPPQDPYPPLQSVGRAAPEAGRDNRVDVRGTGAEARLASRTSSRVDIGREGGNARAASRTGGRLDVGGEAAGSRPATRASGAGPSARYCPSNPTQPLPRGRGPSQPQRQSRPAHSSSTSSGRRRASSSTTTRTTTPPATRHARSAAQESRIQRARQHWHDCLDNYMEIASTRPVDARAMRRAEEVLDEAEERLDEVEMGGGRAI